MPPGEHDQDREARQPQREAAALQARQPLQRPGDDAERHAEERQRKPPGLEDVAPAEDDSRRAGGSEHEDVRRRELQRREETPDRLDHSAVGSKWRASPDEERAHRARENLARRPGEREIQRNPCGGGAADPLFVAGMEVADRGLQMMRSRRCAEDSRMIRRMCIAALAGALLPMTTRAEVDKKIERLWKAKCASCHGADGKGKTEQGEKMGVSDYTDAAWQKAHSDADIKKAITEGVKREKAGKKQEMEPYKDKLSPEQIEQLIAYIRSLK
jgi:cytochrome c553